MTKMTLSIAIILSFSFALPCAGQQNGSIACWLTKGDSSVLFRLQPVTLSFGTHELDSTTIPVNEAQTYQSIDGFGFSLTGGSATPIKRMDAARRKELLQELFDTSGAHIGVSYIRLSIGASDLNEKIFSYDDLPAGKTDTGLVQFDLGPDKQDVIPAMKQILSIYPGIRVLGSPWSPPAWMKTNGDTRGGMLKPEYYGVYARYLVKYIQAMENEGIHIDAITIQNEPLHPGNNPSLLLVAPDEALFVKNFLGPDFAAAHLHTKIIIYDHNADRPDYPISILDDEGAKKYVDGSAFHLYGGSIDALSDVHAAHPDRNIYFTEQMVVQFGRGRNMDHPSIHISSPVSRLFIGATRNWSKTVLEWNLAANSQFTPFTQRGGCDKCQGAVSIDGDSVTRNLGYYAMAHASKFVRPGSIRIASGEIRGLSNVAFKTPAGKKVLIVSNDTKQKQTFSIAYNKQSATTSLDAGSVATYIWE